MSPIADATSSGEIAEKEKYGAWPATRGVLRTSGNLRKRSDLSSQSEGLREQGGQAGQIDAP